MPVAIVVGVQWGDEGKGKIVDYLTERARLVVRFQGGNNAGHTVVVEGKKTALQLIPSGILRDDTRCLLASGVVVNPWSLLEEIRLLEEVGISVTPERFGIAPEVQLILPYHQALDAERESSAKKECIGTTKKGIGPAYEDSVSRFGIRLGDLFDSQRLKLLLERNIDIKNAHLQAVLKSDARFDATELLEQLEQIANRLEPYVANVSAEVDGAIRSDDFVMFEGAQGCLLDINHGTYPFVTSSNTTAGYACASAGFSPKAVDLVLGICKAYCTRVGSGPFPTEDSTPAGDRLRDAGGEYGTVTGRPRRCGWFDSMAVRKAIRLNGIESLILTKLDVLTGFNQIKVATGYSLDGKPLEDLPALAADIDRVQVTYEDVPGWSEDLTAVRRLEDLPQSAQSFLKKIESLVDCEVGGFSVGPDRSQTIIMSERLREFTALP